jgi:glucokinase
MLVVGVDLGGIEVKAGLVDSEKGIVKKYISKTEVSQGKEKVVKNICKAIEEVSKGYSFEAIGIGSPGSIDRDSGIIRFSPNFPEWNDFDLGKKISEVFNKKVYIENDANAFTLGEWYFDKAKGCQNFITLTLGTGVGSGVVSNGTFITGATGIGPELGHFPIVPDGRKCGCENNGCVESHCSSKSVANIAKEMICKYPESDILKLAGDIESIESLHVFKAAEKGDFLAKDIIERTTEVLARAIGGFIHVFNPELIVIGGGMSKAGDALFVPLRNKVLKYVMPSFRNTYKIEQSTLVENAGILGAASAAFFGMKGE